MSFGALGSEIRRFCSIGEADVGVEVSRKSWARGEVISEVVEGDEVVLEGVVLALSMEASAMLAGARLRERRLELGLGQRVVEKRLLLLQRAFLESKYR